MGDGRWEMDMWMGLMVDRYEESCVFGLPKERARGVFKGE